MDSKKVFGVIITLIELCFERIIPDEENSREGGDDIKALFFTNRYFLQHISLSADR